MLRIILHEGLNRDEKTHSLNKIYKEVHEFEKFFKLTSCGISEPNKEQNQIVPVPTLTESPKHLRHEKIEVDYKIDVYKLKEAFKNIGILKDYIADEIQDVNHLRKFIEHARLQDQRN